MNKEMRTAATFRANLVLIAVSLSMLYMIRKYTKKKD